MKHFFRTLAILFALGYFFSGIGDVVGLGEGDRINVAVTPIRDEFTAPAGSVINRQVTFYNNADVPYNIYITTEDCESGNNNGTPICHPAGGAGVDITKSSTWITTSDNGIFTVAPHGNKVVTYTVSVPPNAPPGGHYGAIFFNNPDTDITGGSAVKMNRRIDILYLMTVPGNIIVDTSIGDILVDSGPGGGAGSVGPTSLLTLFSAPSEFFDITMKRLLMVFSDPVETQGILDEINPLWEKPKLPEDHFLVTLKVPVENAGNTHVMPTGKIYLYDGDDRLERIGKQSILNENGVYMGEKIVDFLPINDEGGNVLPNTDRIFNIDWEGFAFDDVDPTTGKHTVGFESPSSYYSKTAGSNAQFVFPWERLAVRGVDKSLRAEVEINYKNPLTGLNEVYTLELPVPIHYNYIAKTLNWSAIVLVLLLASLIWLGRRGRITKSTGGKNRKYNQLEDEIDTLERAKASIESKKKTSKAKTVAKSETKTPTKPLAKASSPKKEAPKKTVPAASKPEIPLAAPAKKPTPQKTTASKTKKTPTPQTEPKE